MAEDDQIDQAYEPLVQRLRNLKWPQLSPEERERYWREFQRMVGDRRSHHAPDPDREA
jgi:hypothetical protein